MRIFFTLLFLWCSLVSAQNYWEPHWQSRMATISMQAQLMGTNRMLLIGDSNTEAYWWGINGNCLALNAGLGGAKIKDVSDRMTAMAPIIKPNLVHIMLGTNNIPLDKTSAEWASMKQDMMVLVQAYQAQGAKVVIWPVPKFTAPFSIDNIARDQINNILYNVVLSTGAYWDWWWPDQNITTLSDGVHFTPQSQISRYNRIQTWINYLNVTC